MSCNLYNQGGKMTARERLKLEFGGISNTIKDYTSNGNIVNYLDGMADAIENKDEDKIQYFGNKVLEWYKQDIEIIGGNEFVFNILDHKNNYKLLDEILVEMRNQPVEKDIKKGAILYTAFDEYKLVKQIGQGGNGIVFSAENIVGINVALKLVDRTALGEEKNKRFKNEIFFCQNSNHQNIIKIIDAGAYGEKYAFYVMPLGIETLRDRIKKGISADSAVEIFVALLHGITYAHDKNVCHRDIKPENILFMDKGNQAIIADFGIAHFCAEEALTIIETKKCDRLANFQYAAPEQRHKGMEVDGRADVYALGLILNEMFTGKIVAGGKYERIADVEKKYGFLDSVFEKIYCQNPKDRLFPAKNILMELKILAEKQRNDEKIDELKAIDYYRNLENDECEKPSFEDIDFANNRLIFKLSNIMPVEWFNYLTNDNYSHRSLMGYEPSKFSGKDDTIMVSLRTGESESSIKSIVEYAKSWLPIVTAGYNANRKSERMRIIRDREQARIAELQKLEKENVIKKSIKNLL